MLRAKHLAHTLVSLRMDRHVVFAFAGYCFDSSWKHDSRDACRFMRGIIAHEWGSIPRILSPVATLVQVCAYSLRALYT